MDRAQNPDLTFTGFFYHDFLNFLQDYRKRNLDEFKDFNDFEPLTQLEKAFALVGHHCCVRTDMAAIEMFLATANLRKSFILHGKMGGYTLAGYSPAYAQMLGTLNTVISTVPFTVVAQYADFATEPDETNTDGINYETTTAVQVTTKTADFTKVYFYDDSDESYTDITTEMNGAGTAQPFGANPAIGDILYFGHNSIIFDKVDFDLTVMGSGITVVWEYPDYNTGQAIWTDLGETDGTSNFTQDGSVSFTLPETSFQLWDKDEVNGQNLYWIRARITAVSTPTPPTLDSIDINTATGFTYVLFPVYQGKTSENESIGTSDGSDNQRFKLAQKPVIDNTVQVEVQETIWQIWDEVDNFFSSTANDNHYRLDEDEDGYIWVVFGDGVNGRVPPNTSSIRSTYRHGADTNGNVGIGAISVNRSGSGYVYDITNPRAAYGWAEAEGTSYVNRLKLRDKIPAVYRARNRAVAISDFEYLSAAFTFADGLQLVERAKAIEEGYGVKTMKLVVVGKGGASLSQAQLTELDDYYNDRDTGIGLANYQCVAENYVANPFSINVKCKGGSKTDIESALLSLFQPDAKRTNGEYIWDFGQTVPLSVIIARAQTVSGVEYVTLVAPTADVTMNSNQLPKLTAANITVIMVN